MQADARGHPLARFEDFLLDIRTGELCKQGGQSIRLPEQSFQILTMLLDHPGEVVGREEIRKRILASRLLPFRANRLANIIAGAILTLVNGFLTFVPPLVGARTPALPEYLFFATIETVCTSVIIWQAWTWSGVKPAVSSERIVRQSEDAITSS